MILYAACYFQLFAQFLLEQWLYIILLMSRKYSLVTLKMAKVKKYLMIFVALMRHQANILYKSFYKRYTVQMIFTLSIWWFNKCVVVHWDQQSYTTCLIKIWETTIDTTVTLKLCAVFVSCAKIQKILNFELSIEGFLLAL